MKDGLFIGVAVGMLAGILLYKNCDEAKNIIDKSEETIKKELKNMSK